MAPRLAKKCSTPSLVFTNRRNAILGLLGIAVVLDLIYLYGHETVQGDLARMMHATFNDFTSQKGESTSGLSKEMQEEGPQVHKVAGLTCQKYGGPSDEVAAEMVYWRDIPNDAKFISPFKKAGPKQKYLTFEPDEGGWNNIRMSMETAVAMAHAMGRTLVLPPEQGMYLLRKDHFGQKNTFTFADFFHFDSVQKEHEGIDVITFEEFLKREGLTGNLRNKATGQVSFPPNNRTVWDGDRKIGVLNRWTRTVATNPVWAFDQCVVAFSTEPGQESTRLNGTMAKVRDGVARNVRINSYTGNPTPVDASAKDRLREMLAHRKDLCIYDDEMQNAKVFHLMGDNLSGARLLVHFYAFLFFEDWRHDLWTKRFVRDHLRYIDEIQCAAARVISALRELSRKHGDGGMFDSFHIRRGDFQYKDTRVEPEEIFANSRDVLVPNSTVYIASDERNMTFFNILRENYNAFFLDDFAHLLHGVNTNYYGMLDQLITSRGRTFIGTYYSTFTGYINRMRGYHSQKDKAEGFETGKINSFYYIPLATKMAVREYQSIDPPMWAREFPVGWRDLDRGFDIVATTIKDE